MSKPIREIIDTVFNHQWRKFLLEQRSASAEKSALRLSIVGRHGRYSIAARLGQLKKQGIEVVPTFFPKTDLAVQAVVAGEAELAPPPASPSSKRSRAA